jgi:tetratricopeptide (TPR) repeat protein
MLVITQKYRINNLLFSLVVLFMSFNWVLKANGEDDNEYMYAFIEATRQEYVGNIIESARLYHSCLNYKRDDYSVLYKLSKIYASVGKYEEAYGYAKRSFNLAPDNEWIRFNYLSVMATMGKQDSALLIIEKEIASNANDVLLFKAWSSIMIQKKQYKKVLKRLEMFEGFDRGLELIKVHCLNQSGKYELAVERSKHLLDVYEEDTEIMGVLAETYMHGKAYEKAKDVYEAILFVEPGKLLFWLSYFDFGLVTANKEILRSFGKKIVDHENTEVSDKIYVVDRLRALNDAGLSYHADSLFEVIKGQHTEWDNGGKTIREYLWKTEEKEEARVYMKSILDENLFKESFWSSFLFTIDYDQADTILKYAANAYKLFSKNPFFAWFYAVSLKNNKQYHEALSLLDQLNISKLENKEIKVELYSIKAEINQGLENYSEADRNFEAALLLDSDNLVVLNNYSYYLSLRGERLEYALSLIEQCIGMNDDNYIYLDTYAWVLFKMGKARYAKKILKDAIRKGGAEHAEILDHYGDVLWALKREEQAVKYWKNALELEVDVQKRSLLEEKIEQFD